MRRISLTFDNGPEPDVTPAVLKCLASHGVEATFFVLGHKSATEEGRRLLGEIHAHGHRIGNHTWSHRTPLGEMDDARESVAEIDRASEAIQGFEEPERLFRPLGGGGRLGPHLLSASARDRLIEGGYTCVVWNAVPGDFRDEQGWVDTAFAMIEEEPEPLVVLHDIPGASLARLDDFLVECGRRGYSFVKDYPVNCVAIDRGKPMALLDSITSGA